MFQMIMLFLCSLYNFGLVVFTGVTPNEGMLFVFAKIIPGILGLLSFGAAILMLTS